MISSLSRGKIEAIDASFRSLREPWADCTSSMGKFLLTVFSGLSELERNLINERTEEGRVSAKKRGVKFGRKFKLTPHQRDQVHTMLKDGQSIRAIARHFNVGVATIDRIKRTMTLSYKSCRSEPLRAYKKIRLAVFEAFVRTGSVRRDQRVSPD